MKRLTRFLVAAMGATALTDTALLNAQTAGGRRSPDVITMPAVPSGSSRSRAPFPAERRFDDVRRPDAEAIDKNIPPNTPATNPEPEPLPAPRVAIFQPSPAPAAAFGTEPGLLPTGRGAVSLAAGTDAARISASLRGPSYPARDVLLYDIESRVTNVHAGMASLRQSTGEMSASGQSQFRAAEDEVNAREKALRASLKVARKADATEWENARTRLATDYEAYAAALERMDAATGAMPTGR